MEGAGGGDIVSLSIPIPTTTGLCKPLTDNAPDSLAPMLASLTDGVNHTSGLAGCTGPATSKRQPLSAACPRWTCCNLQQLPSSTSPPSTSLSLSAISSSLHPLPSCRIWSSCMNQVGGLSSPLLQQECQDYLQVAGTHTGLFPGLIADLSG